MSRYYNNNRRYGGGYRSQRAQMQYVDVDTSDAASSKIVNNNAQFWLLNNILSGEELFNRISITTYVNYISLSLQIKYDDTLGDPGYPANSIQSQNIRVLLVYDKQPNNEHLLDITKVLQDTNVQGVDSTTPLSNYNRSNSDRFVIIKEYYSQLMVSKGLAPVSPSSLRIKDFVKINKVLRETKYSNSIADPNVNIYPTSGAYYLIYYTDKPLNKNCYRVSGTVRFAYKTKEAFI